MAINKSFRNYLFIWLGETISILGSSVTSFGFMVWLFEETATAMPFVITGIAIGLPPMLLSPIAGSLADRFNRRWVMLLADTGAGMVSIFLLFVYFNGQFAVWVIYLSVFVGSIFSTLQGPAYHAAAATMVPKNELVRMGGIQQFGDAAILLLMPILGAALYGSIGLQGIIIFDLVTYLIALIVLLLIPIPQPENFTITENETEKSNLQKVLGDIKFSWGYLVENKGLLSLLLFGAGTSFFMGLSGMVTAPLVLSFGDEQNLSTLQFSAGIVLLISGFIMSVWGGPKKKRIFWGVFAMFLVGVGNLIVGIGPFFYIVVAGMMVNTFFDPIARSLLGAIWQIRVPHDVQGRVYSLRVVISRANNIIATILSGILADYVFDSVDLSEFLPSKVFSSTPGRQFGLVFILSALGVCILSFYFMFNAHLKNLDESISTVDD